MILPTELRERDLGRISGDLGERDRGREELSHGAEGGHGRRLDGAYDGASTADYTLPADVYAAGMLLWAIGRRRFPFTDVERTADVFRRVRAGVRPPLPAAAASILPLAGNAAACAVSSWFGLVTDCWSHDAQARPTMEQVCAELELIPLSAVHALDAVDLEEDAQHLPDVFGAGVGHDPSPFDHPYPFQTTPPRLPHAGAAPQQGTPMQLKGRDS